MKPVRKRQLFYLCGFDPRGGRYYHSLYREEAARQAKVNGMKIDVSEREKAEGDFAERWWVNAETDGECTRTEYTFLVWDDLVRRYWDDTPRFIFTEMLHTVRVFLFSGLIFRYARMSPMQLIAGLYPLTYMLLALGFGGVAWYLFAGFIGTMIPAGVAIVLALIPVLLLLKGLQRLGKRLAVFWLMNIYAFSARWATGEPEGFEERLRMFAERIRGALADAEANGVDEVLLVAHSNGTTLSVPLMAKILRSGDGLPWERFSLMTLGQLIPLQSFIPQAEGYRKALAVMGRDPRLHWVDYTATIDGACFPLLDAVAASGIDHPPGTGPILRSPRFFKLFDPKRYKRLRYRWYTVHFLYLMATEFTGAYDYFSITAGPQTLRERIADQ